MHRIMTFTGKNKIFAGCQLQMPVLFVNASQVNIFQACCTILPFVTAPPTLPATSPVTPPHCQCPMDLYSDSLCPATGPCYRDPGAVTYGPPPLCPVTINCEQTDYLLFQFSGGRKTDYLSNIRVRDFRQLADIQCVNGEWRYYGQARFDTVLRHVVCYSVAIPVELLPG
ncbi:unnamed protein product [Cylicocyclus nassatus]|uniref:Uncharacterized protein n=1 Tax=Cylicocyclus nassatus TaxID=53992 RepID=A0AA36DRZ6_CYLNA|nr:unnamed protein product [Cylicocyclus nassatus]